MALRSSRFSSFTSSLAPLGQLLAPLQRTDQQVTATCQHCRWSVSDSSELFVRFLAANHFRDSVFTHEIVFTKEPRTYAKEAEVPF